MFFLLRKALTRVGKLWRAVAFRATCRFWGYDVVIGRDVMVQRGVRLQTSLGGRIVIGDHVRLQDNVQLVAKRGRLEIGHHTFIGAGSEIVANESVTIGHSVLLAASCVVRDADHGFAPDELIRLQPQSVAPISIGDDAWLSSHVVVTKGVRIGGGCVIGANAVVTSDIAENSIAAGVPARVLRHR